MMRSKKTLIHVAVDINQTANQFKSSIVLVMDNKVVDAKSMLGLSNSVLTSDFFRLEIYGEDAEEAKKAMRDVFLSNGLPVEISDK
ncbi:HPr family phosphocarrier protein [Terribacillus sp. DMT04]|uniref:HPr family phosphocarrier protein n=1 Tax=Terribacillus sp. DMT04 TaxID=2850441 RepID=UPI00352F6006